MLDKKLNIVVLDNGGFGCIDRLQRSCGGASFNNLFRNGSGIDFAGHAASLGAIGAQGSEPCRTRRSAAGGTCRASHFSDRHRHRSDGKHRRGRGLVGCPGARGVEPGPRVALARAAYDAARSQQRFTS